MYEERVLPFSNNAYKVNQCGEILDNRNNKIPVIEIDGFCFVNITWVNGTTNYPLALLVLSAFGKLDLFPTTLFSEIDILFVDNDSKNLSPVNIIYRFKNGKVEVGNYPGFYYIPLNTRHAINVDGDLLSLVTGKLLKWQLNKGGGNNNRKGGYLNVLLNAGNGTTRSISKHRALCFVFKKYNNDVLTLTVNHIDGDPTNNDLSNLEWATYRDNNIHAIKNNLRMSRARTVLVRNLKTGDIRTYPTISQCSQALGYQHTGLVRHRLDSRFSLNRVYEDYLQFKYDDCTPWPEIDLRNTRVTRLGESSDIIARNVFTGELIIFTGTKNGEEQTSVDSRAIARHVREKHQIPIKGWNFQYLDELGQWPKHTRRHLEIYKKYPLHPRHGLIATNVDTQEEIFYTSVKEGAIDLNLDMGALQCAIGRGNKYKGYYFKHFKLEESLGHPTE